MAYEMAITHFAVGQGLCVMIELKYIAKENYEDNYLALIDMGATPIIPQAHIGVEKVNSKIDSNGGILDYVHISHLDSDHYNLFKELKDLTHVKTLIIGGVNKSNPVIINDIFNNISIENFCQINELYLGKPYTREDVIMDVNIDIGDNLYFRINTLIYRADCFDECITETDESILINIGSSIILVSVVEKKGHTKTPLHSYLFTGDSTMHTLTIFNNQKYKFQNETKRLLIPHHGTKKNMDWGILESFLKYYPANVAYVSAACPGFKGWSHPNKEVIDFYTEKGKLKSCDSHYITSFLDYNLGSRLLTCVDSEVKAIYCTYNLDPTDDNHDFSCIRIDKVSFTDIGFCEPDGYEFIV